MSKIEKLKGFLTSRISQIDQELKLNQSETEESERLNLATMRLTFSNIMGSYLNDSSQIAQSYMIQAQMYQELECYDQSINNAKMAKKNIAASQQYHQQEGLERIHLLIVRCLVAKGKYSEAEELLEKIEIKTLLQNYFRVQIQVAVKLNKAQKSTQFENKLQTLIQSQQGLGSLEHGLFRIQKGRNFYIFKNYYGAIEQLSAGMNILIDKKHKNTKEIYLIYRDLANCQLSVNDLDNQYTSLICAQAMARQIQNNQKLMIQVLHSIARNLQQRQLYEKALNELLKVQLLEKQIHGQLSNNLSFTLRQIADLMIKTGKKSQARKYQLEYSRVLGPVTQNSRKKGNKGKQEA